MFPIGCSEGREGQENIKLWDFGSNSQCTPWDAALISMRNIAELLYIHLPTVPTKSCRRLSRACWSLLRQLPGFVVFNPPFLGWIKIFRAWSSVPPRKTHEPRPVAPSISGIFLRGRTLVSRDAPRNIGIEPAEIAAFAQKRGF